MVWIIDFDNFYYVSYLSVVSQLASKLVCVHLLIKLGAYVIYAMYCMRRKLE